MEASTVSRKKMVKRLASGSDKHVTEPLESGANGIRQAAYDDLPAIRDLLGVTWHDTYDSIHGSERVAEITKRWHSVEILTEFLEHPNGHLLVAETGGQINGTAYAQLEPDSFVDIFSLYVAPGSQGGGVGKALLNTVIDTFPGVSLLRLGVMPENTRAIRFYEHNGFRLIGKGEDECGPCTGIEHLTMERRLL